MLGDGEGVCSVSWETVKMIPQVDVPFSILNRNARQSQLLYLPSSILMAILF